MDSVIGRFFALGDDTPFRHPEIWTRQASPDTGVARLCIGGGEDPVGLLLRLGQALTEPLFVLAVIDVSTEATGKYESEAMTDADVASFFDQFGRLFAEHGRAEAWIGSLPDEGGLARDFVVLDDHDLLYAYGPLDVFERILRDVGFTTGLPEIPVPHVHGLNVELAQDLQLREWPGWARVLPLEDE
jgi:hypothetical protein